MAFSQYNTMYIYGFKIKLATIFSLGFLILMFGAACSKDEPVESTTHKIVIPIKRPKPTPTGSSLTNEGKKEDSVKTSSSKVDSVALVEKPKAMPHKSAKFDENQHAQASKRGVYKANRGDTLFKISGKDSVYGKSNLWPSLFRLNVRLLDGMPVSGDLEHKELPEGMELRFVTPDEALNNLNKIGKSAWVVNVFSSKIPEKITPIAVKLMRKNYKVYIADATIKGEKWKRLRVGFFNTKRQAKTAAKEIMSALNAIDTWISKVAEREREEFGGY